MLLFSLPRPLLRRSFIAQSATGEKISLPHLQIRHPRCMIKSGHCSIGLGCSRGSSFALRNGRRTPGGRGSISEKEHMHLVRLEVARPTEVSSHRWPSVVAPRSRGRELELTLVSRYRAPPPSMLLSSTDEGNVPTKLEGGLQTRK